MKKVVVIGASGTIGKAIVKELSSDTEIIAVNHSSGDFQVDLSDYQSIVQLFKDVGPVDGVIVAASRGVVFKPVNEMTTQDYINSTQQKLFGQLTVALEATKALKDGGSITLTTGVMNRDFVAGGSAAAMVNNAVEGFVKAASLDLPRGIRMNVVSPFLLTESIDSYGKLFPGFETIPSEKAARAFRKSVYSIQTGQVYLVS